MFTVSDSGATFFWTGSASSEGLLEFGACDPVDVVCKSPTISGVIFTLPLRQLRNEFRVRSQFQTLFFWLSSSSLSRLTVLNSRFFFSEAFMPETLKRLMLSRLILEVGTSPALTYLSIFVRVVLTKDWIDSTGSFLRLSRAETRKEVNSDSQSPRTVYPNPIIFHPTCQVVT